MAELITGLQGSGKSYYAMHRIKNDKEKYDKVMTDIDGLTTFDNIYALDFPSFVQMVLKPCYEMMVKDINAMEDVDNLTDEEIFSLITTNNSSFQDAIEYLQRIYVLSPNADEHNRLLLIVDESQNYFGKTVKLNAFLLWFITQHRHLYMEVYLISQDHSLIRSDYKLFNIIYVAFPPAKQIVRGSIIYNQFCGFPLNGDNFVQKLMLKKDSKVFDMYESGDKVESPNILKKFIWILLLAVLVVIFGIYYFSSMYGSSPVTSLASSSAISDTPTQSNIKKIDSVSSSNEIIIPHEIDSNSRLYTFVLFNDRFTILDEDDGNYKSLKLFAYIKKHYFIDLVDVIVHDDYHTSIIAVCDSRLEKLFSSSKRKRILTTGVKNMTSFN